MGQGGTWRYILEQCLSQGIMIREIVLKGPISSTAGADVFARKDIAVIGVTDTY